MLNGLPQFLDFASECGDISIGRRLNRANCCRPRRVLGAGGLHRILNFLPHPFRLLREPVSLVRQSSRAKMLDRGADMTKAFLGFGDLRLHVALSWRALDISRFGIGSRRVALNRSA